MGVCGKHRGVKCTREICITSVSHSGKNKRLKPRRNPSVFTLNFACVNIHVSFGFKAPTLNTAQTGGEEEEEEGGVALSFKSRFPFDFHIVGFP